MKLYRELDWNKAAITTVLSEFCVKTKYGNPYVLAEILYGRYVVEDFSIADDYSFWKVRDYLETKVVPHKVEVFKAGVELASHDWFTGFIGQPKEVWLDNLWLHDLSKFSANESIGYAFHDFKRSKPDPGFDRAWLHHKNHNEHHPEYWLNQGRDGVCVPVSMPTIYIAEMVADWIGAGKTYGSTLEAWLPDNLPKFLFHDSTTERLQEILDKIGIETLVADGRLHVHKHLA